MESINESFINILASQIKSELLDDEQIENLNNSNNLNDFLRILNRTSYINISAEVKENDLIHNELLFFNNLFLLVERIKKFSSSRIIKLLTAFYDFYFGFYNSLADLKNADTIFSMFPSSFELAINNKDLFNNEFKLLIDNLIKDFNKTEQLNIYNFLNFRTTGVYNKNSKSEYNAISELLNALFLKESEMNIIMKDLRRLSW